MNELTYTNASGHEVTGTQVGRFLVRERIESDGVPRGTEAMAFVVDHWPTGLLVARFDSRVRALVYADDVSRFALKDPDARDKGALLDQLGPSIVSWIMYMGKTGSSIGFRHWLWKTGRREWPALDPEAQS